MQIPLLRGRFFTDADNEHSARVVVIDESFADQYFPGEDPIGKHLHFTQESSGGPRTDEIVGVVGHVKQFGLEPDKTNNRRGAILRALPADSRSDHAARWRRHARVSFAWRDGVDPESVFPSIRRAMTQLDGQMVVDTCQSMQRVVADSIARQRFAMLLFSIFAAGRAAAGQHRYLRRVVLRCGTAYPRGWHSHGTGRAERRRHDGRCCATAQG